MFISEKATTVSSLKNSFEWLLVNLVNKVGIYLFKVNNRNTRVRCEICSKLIIKTKEQRQWRPSSVFAISFEHILHRSSVFIVNFEHVNVDLEYLSFKLVKIEVQLLITVSNPLTYIIIKCIH